MTYGDIKTAVEGDTIPATQPVAQWVAAAYTSIWSAAPWTFKRVSGVPFYATADGTATGAASATPTMPADIADTLVLTDQNGDELSQLGQQDFERSFNSDVSTGGPTHFTVVDRQIRLWPVPDSAYQFTLSYKRRLATRDSSGNIQAGFFKADTDFPLWDDHHYLIVVRAKLLGLKSLTDPTASALEDEYMDLLAAMREEYTQAVPAGFQVPAWP